MRSFACGLICSLNLINKSAQRLVGVIKFLSYSFGDLMLRLLWEANEFLSAKNGLTDLNGICWIILIRLSVITLVSSFLFANWGLSFRAPLSVLRNIKLFHMWRQSEGKQKHSATAVFKMLNINTSKLFISQTQSWEKLARCRDALKHGRAYYEWKNQNRRWKKVFSLWSIISIEETHLPI